MHSFKQISELLFNNRVVAGASGGLSSLSAYILQINYTDWAIHTTLKVVECGVVGVVGTFLGLLTKHFFEKYFKSSKP